jgi:hypothetical protein
MFQTPWIKDLETALFSGVSKEKPRGGSHRNKLGGAFSLTRKILAFFCTKGEETKDS